MEEKLFLAEKLSPEGDLSMEENTVSGCVCVIQSPLRETAADADCAVSGAFPVSAVLAVAEDFLPSAGCPGTEDFMAPGTCALTPG